MLPEGWKQLRLGDIFKFKNGLNGDSSLYGSGAKFVNVMDVFRGPRLRHHEIIGEMTATAKQIDEFGIKFGDVLFNRTSETDDEIAFATVYLDHEPAVFGGFVIRARPTGVSLTPEFCTYAFQSAFIRRSMIRLGQGAIRSNIGQGDLTTVPMKFPPISEQRKIAEILSTWDRAIAVQERLVANARAQKKALMQTLLTSKKRLPGFKGEWKKLSLSEFSTIIMGSSPASVAYNVEGLGLPLIQGNADIVDRKTAPRMFTTDITQTCKIGDIIFSVRAPVGEISTAIHEACIGRGVAAIRPFSSKDRTFLHYLLLAAEEGWASLSQGSTFQAINSKELSNFEIYVPTLLEEREAIAEAIRASDELEKSLAAQLNKRSHEKSALMQQLLTGKRRVKIGAPDTNFENHIREATKMVGGVTE